MAANVRELKPPARRHTSAGLSSFLARIAPGTKSNFGDMCERMAVSGTGSERCRKCEGTGIVELTVEVLQAWERKVAASKSTEERVQLRVDRAKDDECPRCRGVGYIERPIKKSAYRKSAVTVRCAQCRGCGEVLNDDTEDVCPRCAPYRARGELTCGYVVPVTAKETGSSKHGRSPPRLDTDRNDDPADHWASPTEYTASPVDDEDMAGYGEWARIVERLRQSYPTAARVLELHDGDEGNRWASERWGRIFSIWPETDAGRKLIAAGRRASGDGPGAHLKPIEVLANERDAEEKALHPTLPRRAWIREADRQARLMLDQAQNALAEVRGSM